jgi:hypothetical protein
VFWFDQRTPIVLLGSAVTALMSSALIPLASTIGPVNEEYGASL